MILIDNQLVEFGKFPNGESNLNFNKFSCNDRSIIMLKYESDQDLFNLYILKSYLDSIFVQNRISLFILYMPYSRMDRANQFYTFNLKFVASFINSMKFCCVKVYDAHSEVTLALIDRVEEISMTQVLFEKFREENKNDYNFVVMFPDAGAEKRYSKMFGGYPSVVGSKERDFSTGNIIKFNVSGADVKGKDVVIIDDLCSKGGTFVGATKALKELGAKNIYLIVTHCENTILEGEVFGYIQKVYTTNSIIHQKYIDTTYNSVAILLSKQLDITLLYEVRQNYES